MFPQATGAQRLYNQLMQQSFQLGPKQKQWLDRLEDNSIDISEYSQLNIVDELRLTQAATKNIFNMWDSWYSPREIAFAIRSAPQDYFTESI